MAAYGKVMKLFKSFGRIRIVRDTQVGAGLTSPGWKQPWVQECVDMYERCFKRSSIGRIRKLTKRLCDDAVLRGAFDAIIRLGDRTAVTAWVEAQTSPPPLTPAQQLAARLAGRRRKASRDESLARQKLKKHTRALEREKKAVKRWKAKVAYYDKRGGAPDEG